MRLRAAAVARGGLAPPQGLPPRCPARSGRRVGPAVAAARPDAAGQAGAVLLAGLLMLSSGTGPATASLGVLEGPARIVDGDTLYVQGEKIRLYAVDAPEKAQSCANAQGEAYACGQVALQALKERVGSRAVRCEVKSKDQYGRNVAACAILDGGRGSEDMGAWLVSQGHAVAYKQFGKEYVVLEDKAHATRKGIWQGRFTEPAAWRRQQKAAQVLSGAPPPGGLDSLSSVDGGGAPASAPAPRRAAAPPPPGAAAGRSYAAAAAAGAPAAPPRANFATACAGPVVKGNINSKGDKIYHTITSGQYLAVQIDEAAGERYFCSEAEARAAGWRPAINLPLAPLPRCEPRGRHHQLRSVGARRAPSAAAPRGGRGANSVFASTCTFVQAVAAAVRPQRRPSMSRRAVHLGVFVALALAAAATAPRAAAAGAARPQQQQQQQRLRRSLRAAPPALDAVAAAAAAAAEGGDVPRLLAPLLEPPPPRRRPRPRAHHHQRASRVDEAAGERYFCSGPRGARRAGGPDQATSCSGAGEAAAAPAAAAPAGPAAAPRAAGDMAGAYDDQWHEHWKEGVAPGERWDLGAASPCLAALLERGELAAAGRRALVPGCGRGWDVFALAAAGAAPAVGLDLSEHAVAAAAAARAATLGARPDGAAGRAELAAGSFFEYSHPSGQPFDLGFDYTFLCALHPGMRTDWAAAWARLLRPGGELVTVVFPCGPGPAGAPADPPWQVSPELYSQLLLPAGFERVRLERVPAELSHRGRAGREWLGRRPSMSRRAVHLGVFVALALAAAAAAPRAAAAGAARPQQQQQQQQRLRRSLRAAPPALDAVAAAAAAAAEGGDVPRLLAPLEPAARVAAAADAESLALPPGLLPPPELQRRGAQAAAGGTKPAAAPGAAGWPLLLARPDASLLRPGGLPDELLLDLPPPVSRVLVVRRPDVRAPPGVWVGGVAGAHGPLSVVTLVLSPSGGLYGNVQYVDRTAGSAGSVGALRGFLIGPAAAAAAAGRDAAASGGVPQPRLHWALEHAPPDGEHVAALPDAPPRGAAAAAVSPAGRPAEDGDGDADDSRPSPQPFPQPSPQPSPQPRAPYVHDLLVLYTAAAAAESGVERIEAEVAAAVAMTNAALANTAVPLSVNLLAARPVNGSYAEPAAAGGDMSKLSTTLLYDLRSGKVPGALEAREELGADLVSLFASVPGAPFCGVGFVLTDQFSALADQYSLTAVVNRCWISLQTLSHELGHNWGCMHNYETEGAPSPRAGIDLPSYAFGFARCDPAVGFATLMCAAAARARAAPAAAAAGCRGRARRPPAEPAARPPSPPPTRRARRPPAGPPPAHLTSRAPARPPTRARRSYQICATPYGAGYAVPRVSSYSDPNYLWDADGDGVPEAPLGSAATAHCARRIAELAPLVASYRGPDRGCGPDARLCEGKCLPSSLCCASPDDCPGSQTCPQTGGKCTLQPGSATDCPAGMEACGNACIPGNTCCTADTNGRCPANLVCPGNGQACTCPPGSKLCNERCIGTERCCTAGPDQWVNCKAPLFCPGDGGICSCPPGQRWCNGGCVGPGGCCNRADCAAGERCSAETRKCVAPTPRGCATGKRRCTSGPYAGKGLMVVAVVVVVVMVIMMMMVMIAAVIAEGAAAAPAPRELEQLREAAAALADGGGGGGSSGVPDQAAEEAAACARLVTAALQRPSAALFAGFGGAPCEAPHELAAVAAAHHERVAAQLALLRTLLAVMGPLVLAPAAEGGDETPPQPLPDDGRQRKRPPRAVVGIVEIVELDGASAAPTAEERARAAARGAAVDALLAAALHAGRGLDGAAIAAAAAPPPWAGGGGTELDAHVADVLRGGLRVASPWSGAAAREQCALLLSRLGDRVALAGGGAPVAAGEQQQPGGTAGSWRALLAPLLPELLDRLRDTLLAQHRHRRAQDAGDMALRPRRAVLAGDLRRGPAGALAWQRALLLSVARRLVVGCEESCWATAMPAATALVMALEGRDCRSDAYHGLLAELVSEAERSAHKPAQRLVFMACLALLAPRLGLHAARHLGAAMPLLLEWAHAHDERSAQVALLALARLTAVAWPRMPAHAGVLWRHLLALARRAEERCWLARGAAGDGGGDAAEAELQRSAVMRAALDAADVLAACGGEALAAAVADEEAARGRALADDPVGGAAVRLLLRRCGGAAACSGSGGRGGGSGAPGRGQLGSTLWITNAASKPKPAKARRPPKYILAALAEHAANVSRRGPDSDGPDGGGAPGRAAGGAPGRVGGSKERGRGGAIAARAARGAGPGALADGNATADVLGVAEQEAVGLLHSHGPVAARVQHAVMTTTMTHAQPCGRDVRGGGDSAPRGAMTFAATTTPLARVGSLDMNNAVGGRAASFAGVASGPRPQTPVEPPILGVARAASVDRQRTPAFNNNDIAPAGRSASTTSFAAPMGGALVPVMACCSSDGLSGAEEGIAWAGPGADGGASGESCCDAFCASPLDGLRDGMSPLVDGRDEPAVADHVAATVAAPTSAAAAAALDACADCASVLMCPWAAAGMDWL
ncbi:HOL3 [Scenedesmus sp. PABB004]|nr:HOL3 [Scenedesmus sp. PABB004]